MHDFNWFSLISNRVDHHNIHIFSSAMVVLLIAISSLVAFRKLRKVEERLVPEGKMTLPNLYEVIVENILSLMEGIIGHNAPKYFPLIGALFIYILLCNLLSVIPGFL
ncbi:MAG: F0F1 ATP synthase subunit A, partial [Deltaproteobacteria bacterium]|nr:F0F1 ATP synthase subunit A [Deltaproteobacteria bacterium]